jgi:cytochrome c-type protein NapB
MNFIRPLFLMLCMVAALARQRHALHDSARGPTPIMQATKPPVLGNAVNDDVRRTRNYTWQPPTIPHRVDGYQVDKNFNKCMDCHSRTKAKSRRRCRCR